MLCISSSTRTHLALLFEQLQEVLLVAEVILGANQQILATCDAQTQEALHSQMSFKAVTGAGVAAAAHASTS